MKKIKSIVIALLSVTCLFAATACEGFQFVTPGTTNSSSTETENSSKPKKPLTKAQKEALEEATEKTINTNSVTQSHTIIIRESGSNPLDEGEYWEETKMTGTVKLDGKLQEEKQTEKTRLEEGGKWYTDEDWIYEIEIDENTGVSYWYDEGVWEKNTYSISTNSETTLSGLSPEIEEKIIDQFECEDNVYLITDCEIELDVEDYFGYEGIRGNAYTTIKELRIELQDGYCSKVCLEQTLDVEATVEVEGEEITVTMHMEIESTFLFTDYGKTTITLPDEIKAEVEALRNG